LQAYQLPLPKPLGCSSAATYIQAGCGPLILLVSLFFTERVIK